MTSDKRKTWLDGVYLGPAAVLDDTDYVKRLRDEIGLNAVVLSYTGELPDELMELSPYRGKTPSDSDLEDLILRHFDGRPVDPLEYDRAKALCGPGVSATGDDATFRKAVEQLKELGLETWICGGAWTIRRLMFCPSNPDVREWMTAVCVHWGSQYGVEALDITHFRYPMGSFPLGLFGCTCNHCRSEATTLGYDMDEMVAGLTDAREKLRKLDGKRLGQVTRLGFGFFDVVHALGLSSGFLDWWRFRQDLVVKNLKQFKAAVHDASPDTRFGTDTYPASMAMTAGHDYLRWDEMADYASPLVSHISAFVCNTFIEWARFLQAEVPNLSEADALQTVYRFLGYDGMGLPETIETMDVAEPDLAARIPTADLVLRDLVKAKLLLPDGVPSYPIIHGHGWSRETIDRIVDEAKELGHNGIVWQGTDELVSDK